MRISLIILQNKNGDKKYIETKDFNVDEIYRVARNFAFESNSTTAASFVETVFLNTLEFEMFKKTNSFDGIDELKGEKIITIEAFSNKQERLNKTLLNLDEGQIILDGSVLIEDTSDLILAHEAKVVNENYNLTKLYLESEVS